MNERQRNLDRIDLQILDILQRHAKISNVELAKQVNLSASPCLDRVRRLEKIGIVKRYVAILDADKLNVGMTAFIEVTLDRTKADDFTEFKRNLVNINEVAECHMVAGGFDYLIKIRVSDMKAYRHVLGKIVDLKGVAQTHTYVVIEDVKEDLGISLFD